MCTLPNNHTIKSLLKSRHNENSNYHCLLLENMTSKQWLKIKSSVIDTNNHLNGIFSMFNSLNSELFPGSRLVDIFSSSFSFNQANYKDIESKAIHFCKLNDIVLHATSNPKSTINISDVSIRNNIAISVVYIHLHSNSIKKISHHAVGITSTEAELFAIRCGINQVI